MLCEKKGGFLWRNLIFWANIFFNIECFSPKIPFIYQEQSQEWFNRSNIMTKYYLFYGEKKNWAPWPTVVFLFPRMSMRQRCAPRCCHALCPNFIQWVPPHRQLALIHGPAHTSNNCFKCMLSLLQSFVCASYVCRYWWLASAFTVHSPSQVPPGRNLFATFLLSWTFHMLPTSHL